MKPLTIVVASCIYEITNTINGHRYIGSTVNYRKRKQEHLKRLRGGYHHSDHLQRAFNKYGEMAFAFKPLVICETHEMHRIEQGILDRTRPEYNMIPVSSGRVFKHDEETLQKIRDARRRQPSPNKGVRMSEEQKKKISLAKMGQVAWNKGKAWSEEARKKMSDSHKGMVFTEEWCQHLKESHFGESRNPEWIKKVADAHRGTHHSEASREKMRQSRLRWLEAHKCQTDL